jgi:hypothetical protein
LRKYLILVVLVVALAITATVIVRRDDTAARQDRQDARLLQFDEHDVTGLVITAQGRDWRFTRDNLEWRLVQPVEDAADADAIDDLVSACEQVVVTSTVDDPEALSAYGLDPPVATLRFEGVDASVHLGNPVATGGLYARIDERPGVLVLEASGRSESFQKCSDPNRFRETAFLSLTRAGIDSLSLVSRDAEVRLDRLEDGWWMTQPRRLPAADEGVEQIVRAMEQTEIRGIFDEADPGERVPGVEDGGVEIAVGAGDRRQAFVMGPSNDDGSRLATRDDRNCLLEVHAPALDGLPLDPMSLGPRRLSRINRYRIERFSYRRGSDSLVAERRGDTWTDADGTSLPDPAIYEFLAGLLETPVTRWRDARNGAGDAVAELEYRLDGGKEGRIEFLAGNVGRISEASGIVYELAAAPPAAPRFP